jgi:hypothetical protein
MKDARADSRSNHISRKGPLKVISIITLWSFLFTTGGVDTLVERAWAARATPELTSVGSEEPGSPSSTKELNVKTFSLPQNLGHIRDSYDAGSSTTVIHIQDAHCNYACQRKLSELIDYFNKEYGIRSVNLEGGVGDYDLAIFDSINDPDTRERVSDYFVKDGLVNGAEYFAINNPNKAALWGVEDTKLYVDNLKVYKNSLKYKDKVDKYLNEISYILGNIKNKLYPPELLDLDKKFTEYKENKLDFKDYVLCLVKYGNRQAINIKSYTNLYLLQQSLEQEGGIDFKKADTEKSKLVDLLQKSLPKKQLEELVVMTVEFQAEKIAQGDFYTYLLKKAKIANIEIKDMPELQKYIVYISLYQAIDKAKILEEMAALESKIKEGLYQNDDQRKLDELSKNLTLTKNIFNIAITRDDYKYYLANEGSFAVKNFKSFIENQAPKWKIQAKLSDGIDELDAYRNEISEFYAYSFKRDDAFLKNMKMGLPGERAPPSSKKYAVIVSGGFHTENLCDLFKKNNISYVSIIPTFRNDEGYQSPYFNLLAGKEPGMVDKLAPVMASASSMQIATMLSSLGEAVWGKDNVNAFRAAVRIQAMIEEDGAVQLLLPDGKKMNFGDGEDGTEITLAELQKDITAGSALKRVGAAAATAKIVTTLDANARKRAELEKLAIAAVATKPYGVDAKVITSDLGSDMGPAFNFVSSDGTRVIVLNSSPAFVDAKGNLKFEQESLFHEAREAYWRDRGYTMRDAHIVASAEQAAAFAQKISKTGTATITNGMVDGLTGYHAAELNRMASDELRDLVRETREYQRSVLERAQGEGARFNMPDAVLYEQTMKKAALSKWVASVFVTPEMTRDQKLARLETFLRDAAGLNRLAVNDLMALLRKPGTSINVFAELQRLKLSDLDVQRVRDILSEPETKEEQLKQMIQAFSEAGVDVNGIDNVKALVDALGMLTNNIVKSNLQQKPLRYLTDPAGNVMRDAKGDIVSLRGNSMLVYEMVDPTYGTIIVKFPRTDKKRDGTKIRPEDVDKMQKDISGKYAGAKAKLGSIFVPQVIENLRFTVMDENGQEQVVDVPFAIVQTKVMVVDEALTSIRQAEQKVDSDMQRAVAALGARPGLLSPVKRKEYDDKLTKITADADRSKKDLKAQTDKIWTAINNLFNKMKDRGVFDRDTQNAKNNYGFMGYDNNTRSYDPDSVVGFDADFYEVSVDSKKHPDRWSVAPSYFNEEIKARAATIVSRFMDMTAAQPKLDTMTILTGVAGTTVEPSRGFAGMNNDFYADPIKNAIWKGSFTAIQPSADGRFTGTKLNLDNGNALAGRLALNQQQVKNLNATLSALSEEDRALLGEDATILFIGGLDDAVSTQVGEACYGTHYGIQRNQYYIDTKHIADPAELAKQLRHEIQERAAVVNGLNAQEQSTPLARRSPQPVKKINNLAYAAHNRMVSEELAQAAGRGVRQAAIAGSAVIVDHNVAMMQSNAFDKVLAGESVGGNAGQGYAGVNVMVTADGRIEEKGIGNIQNLDDKYRDNSKYKNIAFSIEVMTSKIILSRSIGVDYLSPQAQENIRLAVEKYNAVVSEKLAKISPQMRQAIAQKGLAVAAPTKQLRQISPQTNRNFVAFIGATRLVAVPDVYADYNELIKHLAAAGIVAVDKQGNVKFTFKKGEVVSFAGDYIDRGKQNVAVVKFIMKMIKEAQAAGAMVITIEGNHDYVMRKLFEDMGTMGKVDLKTAQERAGDIAFKLGFNPRAVMDVMNTVQEFYENYKGSSAEVDKYGEFGAAFQNMKKDGVVDFFLNLKRVAAVDGNIIAHASIPAAVFNYVYDPANAAKVDGTKGGLMAGLDEAIGMFFDAERGMDIWPYAKEWASEGAERSDRERLYEAMRKQMGLGKDVNFRLIVGHAVGSGEIKNFTGLDSDVYCIDGGMSGNYRQRGSKGGILEVDPLGNVAKYEEGAQGLMNRTVIAKAAPAARPAAAIAARPAVKKMAPALGAYPASLATFLTGCSNIGPLVLGRRTQLQAGDIMLSASGTSRAVTSIDGNDVVMENLSTGREDIVKLDQINRRLSQGAASAWRPTGSMKEDQYLPALSIFLANFYNRSPNILGNIDQPQKGDIILSASGTLRLVKEVRGEDIICENLTKGGEQKNYTLDDIAMGISGNVVTVWRPLAGLMGTDVAAAAGVAIVGGRGADNLPNDSYTTLIKVALRRGQFLAYNISAGNAVKTGITLDRTLDENAGHQAGDIIDGLDSPEKAAFLKEVIGSLGIADMLKDTTLIFIRGQKAHYSLGRNQIYLDSSLLEKGKEKELTAKLMHEIKERNDVLKGLRRDLRAELERTANNPEARSKKLNSEIDRLAGQSHYRIEDVTAALNKLNDAQYTAGVVDYVKGKAISISDPSAVGFSALIPQKAVADMASRAGGYKGDIADGLVAELDGVGRHTLAFELRTPGDEQVPVELKRFQSVMTGRKETPESALTREMGAKDFAEAIKKIKDSGGDAIAAFDMIEATNGEKIILQVRANNTLLDEMEQAQDDNARETLKTETKSFLESLRARGLYFTVDTESNILGNIGRMSDGTLKVLDFMNLTVSPATPDIDAALATATNNAILHKAELVVLLGKNKPVPSMKDVGNLKNAVSMFEGAKSGLAGEAKKVLGDAKLRHAVSFVKTAELDKARFSVKRVVEKLNANIVPMQNDINDLKIAISILQARDKKLLNAATAALKDAEELRAAEDKSIEDIRQEALKANEGVEAIDLNVALDMLVNLNAAGIVQKEAVDALRGQMKINILDRVQLQMATAAITKALELSKAADVIDNAINKEIVKHNKTLLSKDVMETLEEHNDAESMARAISMFGVTSEEFNAIQTELDKGIKTQNVDIFRKQMIQNPFDAANAAGGDWHSFAESKDGRFALMEMGDVSGHGIQGAIVGCILYRIAKDFRYPMNGKMMTAIEAIETIASTMPEGDQVGQTKKVLSAYQAYLQAAMSLELAKVGLGSTRMFITYNSVLIDNRLKRTYDYNAGGMPIAVISRDVPTDLTAKIKEIMSDAMLTNESDKRAAVDKYIADNITSESSKKKATALGFVREKAIEPLKNIDMLDPNQVETLLPAYARANIIVKDNVRAIVFANDRFNEAMDAERNDIYDPADFKVGSYAPFTDKTANDYFLMKASHEALQIAAGKSTIDSMAKNMVKKDVIQPDGTVKTVDSIVHDDANLLIYRLSDVRRPVVPAAPTAMVVTPAVEKAAITPEDKITQYLLEAGEALKRLRDTGLEEHFTAAASSLNKAVEMDPKLGGIPTATIAHFAVDFLQAPAKDKTAFRKFLSKLDPALRAESRAKAKALFTIYEKDYDAGKYKMNATLYPDADGSVGTLEVAGYDELGPIDESKKVLDTSGQSISTSGVIGPVVPSPTSLVASPYSQALDRIVAEQLIPGSKLDQAALNNAAKDVLGSLTKNSALTADKVIKQLLEALDSSPLSAENKQMIEASLRFVVIAESLSSAWPNKLNVVVQFLPDLGLKAPGTNIGNRAGGVIEKDFNVSAKSIIGMEDASDFEIADIITKAAKAMEAAAAPKDARAIVFLPKKLEKTFSLVMKDLAEKNTPGLDRVRVVSIDTAGEFPDTATFFAFGIKLLDYDRLTAEERAAQDHQDLLNMIALVASGKEDPKDILKKIFEKGYTLPIRKINFNDIKAWKRAQDAVLMSL